MTGYDLAMFGALFGLAIFWLLSVWLRQKEKRKQWFLALVQTQALYLCLKGVNDSPLWPLADAMRLDSRCIPEHMEIAALDYVAAIYGGKPEPGWVRYVAADDPIPVNPPADSGVEGKA